MEMKGVLFIKVKVEELTLLKENGKANSLPGMLGYTTMCWPNQFNSIQTMNERMFRSNLWKVELFSG